MSAYGSVQRPSSQSSARPPTMVSSTPLSAASPPPHRSSATCDPYERPPHHRPSSASAATHHPGSVAPTYDRGTTRLSGHPTRFPAPPPLRRWGQSSDYSVTRLLHGGVAGGAGAPALGPRAHGSADHQYYAVRRHSAAHAPSTTPALPHGAGLLPRVSGGSPHSRRAVQTVAATPPSHATTASLPSSAAVARHYSPVDRHAPPSRPLAPVYAPWDAASAAACAPHATDGGGRRWAAEPAGPGAAAPRAVRACLRLSNFAATVVVSGPASPLLLRGAVTGTGVRFATESAWPEPPSHRDQQTRRGVHGEPAGSPTCVVWTSSLAEATIDMIESRCDEDEGGSLPQTLVLECYAAARWQGPTTSGGAIQQLTEDRYIGRCHVSLRDLRANTDAVDACVPGEVEAVLRDGFGAPVGRVCFDAALTVLVQRTVRLGDVVVLPDPLRADEVRGELEVALVPPLFEAAEAGREEEPDTMVLVSADSRSPGAARWTALPPISYLDEPDAATPLLRGHLYCCDYGREGEHPAGSPPQPNGRPQMSPPRRVLLGTFTIPPPPPRTGRAAHHGSMSPRRLSDYAAAWCPAPLYHFEVPLHPPGDGGHRIASGECWVRGAVETWTVPQVGTEAEADDVYNPSESAPRPPQMPPHVRHHWTPTPPSHGAASATALNENGHPVTEAVRGDATAVNGISPSPWRPAAFGSVVPAPPPPPPSPPEEDAALQQVRERQEALIERVEQRLAAVVERRQELQREMAAAAAQARQEENAIAEEYGQLESDLKEAEAAYEAAAGELVELREYCAARASEHDAYAAEQQRALAEVARERQEASAMRQQLELLRAQMAEHLAVEQQRCAARVAQTQAAMEQVDESARWLTEVEAKIAATAAPTAAAPPRV
ncbi:hypothetical protein NESM_000101700 [Novymonas esmeraldas]|uniref:Uncharacterized protein n=1 Tax=Novymonas esmeraldas TaxID=1808958 RepID=A0AAW0F4V3_9TRYP